MTDGPRHGKRDELAFHGEALGASKTRAEGVGRELRSVFEGMHRMLEALATDGIAIDPAQVSFSDDVLAAAWAQFCRPSNLRNPLDPPMMDDEDQILRAVQ